MASSLNAKHRMQLAQADAARALLEPQAAASPLRQRYHFMPPARGDNDPNGCVYHNGRHHLFYQHNPYAPQWAAMHWGHAVTGSASLGVTAHRACPQQRTWTITPAEVAFPAVPCRCRAIGWPLYTPPVNALNPNAVTQCMAVSNDGVHFNKLEHNPIVATAAAECAL